MLTSNLSSNCRLSWAGTLVENTSWYVATQCCNIIVEEWHRPCPHRSLCEGHLYPEEEWEGATTFHRSRSVSGRTFRPTLLLRMQHPANWCPQNFMALNGLLQYMNVKCFHQPNAMNFPKKFYLNTIIIFLNFYNIVLQFLGDRKMTGELVCGRHELWQHQTWRTACFLFFFVYLHVENDYIYCLLYPESISRPYIDMESASVLELSENVVLNCSHDNGTRTTYKWFKGGKPVTNVTRFMLSSDQKFLTITRVLMADDDIYSCTVENPVGNMTSLPIRLTVYSKWYCQQELNIQRWIYYLYMLIRRTQKGYSDRKTLLQAIVISFNIIYHFSYSIKNSMRSEIQNDNQLINDW